MTTNNNAEANNSGTLGERIASTAGGVIGIPLGPAAAVGLLVADDLFATACGYQLEPSPDHGMNFGGLHAVVETPSVPQYVPTLVDAVAFPIGMGGLFMGPFIGAYVGSKVVRKLYHALGGK